MLDGYNGKRMILRTITLMTLVFLILSGCGPMIHIYIDSISSPLSKEKKSYILLPGNKDTSINDLQFKEFATYVNRALLSQGFIPAKTIDEADVAIFLSYGISDPKEHQYTYSIPIYGQTGFSPVTIFGSEYGPTTIYQPTYGIRGYKTVSGSHTTYFRFMILDAYDLNAFRERKELMQLWKTTATSTGSSGDLRRIFPILVAASKAYLASNTGEKVKVILFENDKIVSEIKGNIP